jgi:hypothetical protein
VSFFFLFLVRWVTLVTPTFKPWAERPLFFAENSMALLYSEIVNLCFWLPGTLGRAGHGEEQSRGGLLGVG